MSAVQARPAALERLDEDVRGRGPHRGTPRRGDAEHPDQSRGQLSALTECFYATQHRNAAGPRAHFGLPTERVVTPATLVDG